MINSLTAFNNILSDLFERQPLSPMLVEDPRIDPLAVETNTQMYQRLIRSSTVLEQRQEGLLYAYYFGRYLSQMSMKDSRKCRQIVGKYYVKTSSRVYRLFSIMGPDQ